MKIMAIDYGDAHTGIAISDATGTLAGFSTVINSRRPEVVAQEIAALIPQHGVGELVPTERTPMTSIFFAASKISFLMAGSPRMMSTTRP